MVTVVFPFVLTLGFPHFSAVGAPLRTSSFNEAEKIVLPLRQLNLIQKTPEPQTKTPGSLLSIDVGPISYNWVI